MRYEDDILSKTVLILIQSPVACSFHEAGEIKGELERKSVLWSLSKYKFRSSVGQKNSSRPEKDKDKATYIEHFDSFKTIILI